MSTITNAPRQFRFYAAAIALAALVITLLAVTFATGPAQAQNAGNTYPDPQPCGTGAAEASQPEPHEVTEGHFALFDAYWRTTEPINTTDGTVNTGVLHTNLCPPKVTQTTKRVRGRTVTTTTRHVSNIDIEEAIMHVLNKHKVDVVATNAEATSGQLSLEEYPDVRKAFHLGPSDPLPSGTQVWWLRLDDPDTVDDPNTPEKENDETSDLSLGFSTLLLDGNYWLKGTEGNPMRYKFEVKSYPTGPADDPHFFTYEAPKAGNAEAELVWDSTKPDIDDDDMLLDPGEYRALQWVFTKPGTYVVSVHLEGFVRKVNPHLPDHPDYDANWEPISENEDETSGVKKYTIQVGDKLDETEPPIFGVSLSVAENTPAGVSVGGPVPVYNADADDLYYGLAGDGSDNFKTEKTTDPHAVQILVADGASLDFETKEPKPPSYELKLTVTDKLDHEGNPQDEGEVEIDDTMIVMIALEDQAPGLDLQVDQAYPAVGETVNFIARYEPTPELVDQAVDYVWAERIQTLHDGIKWHPVDFGHDAPTWSVSQSSPVSKVYRVSVEWDDDDDPATPMKFVNSEEIRVTWGDPGN